MADDFDLKSYLKDGGINAKSKKPLQENFLRRALGMNYPMKRVKSSNLKAVGYNTKDKILTIEYLADDAVYEYYDVPYQVYRELMKADSKGKYNHKNIRINYRYKRIK